MRQLPLPLQLQLHLTFDAAQEILANATEKVLLAGEARARAEHTIAQLKRNRALAEQLRQEIEATLAALRM